MNNINDYQRHLTREIGTIQSCITVMYFNKSWSIELKSYLSVLYVLFNPVFQSANQKIRLNWRRATKNTLK